MNMKEAEEIFGEAISVYTRDQAHEDGILVDLSKLEGAKLFKHPVSFTSNLYNRLMKGEGTKPNVLDARVWDVCWMSIMAVKAQGRDSGTEDVFFKVIVGKETLALWANCGPADDGSPCITIGFPEDR
jgi:hypothetical protein